VFIGCSCVGGPKPLWIGAWVARQPKQIVIDLKVVPYSLSFLNFNLIYKNTNNIHSEDSITRRYICPNGGSGQSDLGVTRSDTD
jgi:hypothetical protein